jgi:hypothetical protein
VLRKLLITTALCAPMLMVPASASAVPVAYLASVISGTFGVSFATTVGILGGALQLGASALLSALLNRRRTPGQQEIKRELSLPQSRPPKRFAYGRTRVAGTPAPIRVKGRYLYMCIILNSRPSAGGVVKITFDGRASEFVAGDLYDFEGSGARLEIDGYPPHVGDQFFPHAWLGLGDQTGPPDEILADLPDDLLATDGWRGLTVLWLRLESGETERRFDRWPRTPPEVEVEMDWSRVWDMRDETQDPDDPDTWEWSNNQALCLLDAILNNPIRRRPRALVDVDSFADAADVADETVPRHYAGGSVPRYTANGLLVWRDAELMDQVAPLADAGGGDLVQSGGVLGYVPPVAKAPTYTITDVLEGEFEFTRLVPGSDLPVAVRASYVAPDRDWQDAELPALAVGAGSPATIDDGTLDLPLAFVTEPTQAMRLQKIARNRIAAQKRLTLLLPPDAIQLTGGDMVAWGIPELPKCAGNWRVRTINPNIWLQGEGVAMRCPVELAEEPAALDAWTPATDEFELATEEYTPPAPVRVAPDDLSATTGPGVVSGGVPRIRFSFEPVTGNVVGYEWQWRQTAGEYAEGGQIAATVLDSADRVFGFLAPVDPGTEYQIRVRTLYLGGISDWTDTSITALGPEFDLDPPSDGQATGGEGQIEVSFLTPNNTDFQAIEFWGSGTDDSGAAILLATIASAANTVRTIVEGDLGDDETRYYFGRSVGPFGSVSAFSASVSATTDP